MLLPVLPVRILTGFGVSRRRLPLPECKDNPNTVLAVTKRGGHVAFLQGLWPFGTSWMDTVSCEFLAPYLETPAARL